ncbi:MAG: YggS family pyridoxal phosphate-dependent enzyme [Acidobacteriota bacterium]|nr:MAG: YggS family pyridoxal phosphate-dependent enzyme [Acidobacteriota bacterium]
MDIPTRFEEIRDRMERAIVRAGRDSRDGSAVKLVAVTKTRSVDEMAAAVAAGVTDIGENKVQEAEAKKPELHASARWHFVGHLQKNKAKKAVELFDLIHTVDSAAIGQRIDRLAAERDKVQPVLVQVDLAGEETKDGLPEEELLPTLEKLNECSNLRVDGLMVLPPYFEDTDEVRPYFQRLRELSENGRERGLVGSELSMGMSHDFEVAIEEGATIIRVGTALFGPRTRKKVVGTEQVV